MNIFVTDENPCIAATHLDDKRVVKMVLESAQMLCTALHINNASHLAKYKSTHINHPSNVWCRETHLNYSWLLMHFKALATEYNIRFNKEHKSFELFDDLYKGIKHIPKGKITPFANCAARADMGISYKHLNDVHEAYRLYLIDRWATDKVKPKWTKRTRPF